jgi:endothelin-converting enzyme/putative endopeptidase
MLLGEALGKLYVEKKFPAEAKEKAEKMIQNIILAYHRISNFGCRQRQKLKPLKN